MSFLQKLCDVYDAVIDTTGAEGENALLPIGFVQKKIKYNVLLSPSGEFVTAQLLPDDAQSLSLIALAVLIAITQRSLDILQRGNELAAALQLALALLIGGLDGGCCCITWEP